MDLGIRGKTVLITGASRGIGRQIAIDLSKENCNICIVARTESELKDTMCDMVDNNHMYIAIDLMKEESIKNVLDKFYSHYNKYPEILINNVGSTLNIKNPLCSLNDWRKVWRINVEIMIDFCRMIIPSMQKEKWGRIINISSISGMHNQGPVAYCSAKTMILAYTRSMGRIYAKDGIVISSVMPGAVFTKDGYWDKTSKEYQEKYLKEHCPLGKFGEPKDISSVVTFLCSQQAKFCQGTLLPVDGGQSKHFFWVRDY